MHKQTHANDIIQSDATRHFCGRPRYVLSPSIIRLAISLCASSNIPEISSAYVAPDSCTPKHSQLARSWCSAIWNVFCSARRTRTAELCCTYLIVR